MKTRGLTMDDHLSQVAEQKDLLDGEVYESVPCEGLVNVKSAFMAYRSEYDAVHPNRPYMHIIGECYELTGDMPYGVTTLSFDEDGSIPVDLMYEFSDDELANMVHKGLYEPGFDVPNILLEQDELIMPFDCRFAVIPPSEEIGREFPIIFANIDNRRSVVVSTETCGYVMGDYFEEPSLDQFMQTSFDIDSFNLDQKTLIGEHEEYGFDNEDDMLNEIGISDEEQALREQYSDIHERVIDEHVDKKSFEVEPEDDKQSDFNLIGDKSDSGLFADFNFIDEPVVVDDALEESDDSAFVDFDDASEEIEQFVPEVETESEPDVVEEESVDVPSGEFTPTQLSFDDIFGSDGEDAEEQHDDVVKTVAVEQTEEANEAPAERKDEDKLVEDIKSEDGESLHFE